jgi:hypothetical protein
VSVIAGAEPSPQHIAAFTSLLVSTSRLATIYDRIGRMLLSNLVHRAAEDTKASISPVACNASPCRILCCETCRFWGDRVVPLGKTISHSTFQTKRKAETNEVLGGIQSKISRKEIQDPTCPRSRRLSTLQTLKQKKNFSTAKFGGLP